MVSVGESGVVRAILNGGLGGVLATEQFNKLCNSLVYRLHTYRTQQLNLQETTSEEGGPRSKGTDVP